MKWRLGLDVGTNSLGWAALEITDGVDDRGKPLGQPTRLIDSGVRVFSDGRNAKSKQSNAAERREPRAARRNRDRYKNRRKRLFNELVQFGLMPKDKAAQKLLESFDPWILRAQGLHQKLDIHQLGRALFHLHQRRGFKSNRKTDRGDKESGKVADATKRTLAQMDEQGVTTLGELFGKPRLKAQEFNKTAPRGKRKPQPLARVRKSGEGAKWAYDYYPTRALIEHEFDELWKAQSAYHSDILTDKAKSAIKETLLWQWPLKPQPVGKCTLLPEEPRAPKALPSSQLVRIYQEVNNLRVGYTGRVDRPLNMDERNTLVEKLKTTGKPTFASLRKLLKIPTGERFNLESEKRKDLKGDETAMIMKNDKCWGKAWLDLSLTEQDAIITKLLDEESEEKVLSWLQSDYGFSAARAQAIANASLPAGYGMLSSKAIGKLLLVFMDDVIVYSDAVGKAFGTSHSNFETGEVFDEALPYYGEILTRHVAFGTGDPKDLPEKRYGKLANPTVHVSMNQIRAVINDLLKRFGPPEQIVLELARDLPMSADGKRELESSQKKNQEANEKRAKELEEDFKVPNNYENRMRLRLWEELDVIGRACVFTGRIIGREMLFSPEVEIEHLLPFSWSFDDGIGNKVLCMREANRAKGNRTPFEAFGHSPVINGIHYDWDEISARSAALPRSKQWRFSGNAREIFEKDHKGFMPRQLTDTRYIARLARQYVGAIFGGQGSKGIENRVWSVNGRLTSDLRWQLGLDSVLAGHNSAIGGDVKKNRNDHRHHAIDAIVIALTDRSMVKKASNQARKNHEKWNNRLLCDLQEPWKGFREDVAKSIGEIKVSHKPDHGIQGALHNDTAYGLVKGAEGEPDKKGVRTVVRRVPLDSFDNPASLGKIRDHVIQSHLLQETEGLTGKDFKAALLQAGENMTPPVRKIRIEEKLKVITINNKSGKPYKGYKGDSNYCYDIWMGDKGKWEGEVISTFDANQKGFDWRSKTARNGKPLIMRIRKNDYVQLEQDDQIKLLQIYKFSKGMINMAEHYEANVDARVREKDLKSIQMAPSSLQKAKARRVTVTPSGKLYYPGPAS